ncbi:MAG: hypothetical protein M1817_004919 [Caeruleum heppii]|nr:MAG: hypothetical protein M1817_004919 [Caeruleum heppii]
MAAIGPLRDMRQLDGHDGCFFRRQSLRLSIALPSKGLLSPVSLSSRSNTPFRSSISVQGPPTGGDISTPAPESYRRRSLWGDAEMTMDADTDVQQSMSICRSWLAEITAILHSHPSQLGSFLSYAKSIMEALDDVRFLESDGELEEQFSLIGRLQDLAFHDIDNFGDWDIADWCERQYLTVLTERGDSVTALQGLGRNWLSRAQPYLSRMYEDLGSASSQLSISSLPEDAWYSEADECRDAANSVAEAETRINTATYVIARALLVSACDFYKRAVEGARVQGSLNGELLTSTAEAYMSLGNVSSLRSAEEHLITALDYLREARNCANYTLPIHLQRYLEYYGRYV